MSVLAFFFDIPSLSTMFSITSIATLTLIESSCKGSVAYVTAFISAGYFVSALICHGLAECKLLTSPRKPGDAGLSFSMSFLSFVSLSL